MLQEFRGHKYTVLLMCNVLDTPLHKKQHWCGLFLWVAVFAAREGAISLWEIFAAAVLAHLRDTVMPENWNHFCLPGAPTNWKFSSKLSSGSLPSLFALKIVACHSLNFSNTWSKAGALL
jgi:hypothetical protein